MVTIMCSSPQTIRDHVTFIWRRRGTIQPYMQCIRPTIVYHSCLCMDTSHAHFTSVSCASGYHHLPFITKSSTYGYHYVHPLPYQNSPTYHQKETTSLSHINAFSYHSALYQVYVPYRVAPLLTIPREYGYCEAPFATLYRKHMTTMILHSPPPHHRSRFLHTSLIELLLCILHHTIELLPCLLHYHRTLTLSTSYS